LALVEVRRGLAMQCVVPVEMTAAWIQSATTNMINLKRAARALDAEGLLLSRQGDTNGALSASLDLFRFGQAMQQGGVLIDFLVGSAVEVMGVRRITNLLAVLNAAECKRTAFALQEHEKHREPLQAIQRRDREWSRKSFSLVDRVREMIEWRSLRPGKAFEGLVPDVPTEYNSRVRIARLALFRVAARAFELERGTPPRQPSDLVPAYLTSVPVDPATGKPLELP
jgi:hypothetical protein